ncbi:hypothetical protein CEXT_169911 [Caerostris extrusa]|uniref:Uncharacterized protein n=1 Tax=Caerostris extrusa TaxID=172846 RepID=A0AAV4UM05_CAEEX|nr:hypothetical protein CEXT_169911 [Caerostris extrusa]
MSILIPIPTGVLQKKCKKKKNQNETKRNLNPCPLKWQPTVFVSKKRSISLEQIEGRRLKVLAICCTEWVGSRAAVKGEPQRSYRLKTNTSSILEKHKRKRERRGNKFIKIPCPIVKRGRWGWRKGYFVCEKERDPKETAAENTVDDESSDSVMELVFAVLLHRRVFRFTKELMLRVVKRTILHRCLLFYYLLVPFYQKEQALKMQIDDGADKTF